MSFLPNLRPGIVPSVPLREAEPGAGGRSEICYSGHGDQGTLVTIGEKRGEKRPVTT